MQVELDACSYSQSLMSFLDDSHFFPGCQSVLRAGGDYTNNVFGAFHQKHASSTIEGKRDHECHDTTLTGAKPRCDTNLEQLCKLLYTRWWLVYGPPLNISSLLASFSSGRQSETPDQG